MSANLSKEHNKMNSKLLILLAAIVGLSQGCSWVNGKVTEQRFGTTSDTAVVSTCNATQTQGYGGGAGTSADPYMLCSVAHWLALGATSSDWGKSFKLGSDIDLSSVTSGSFVKIGSAGTPFTGSLNGANYTIKNLTMSSNVDLALFGVTSGATFSNLNLSSFTLTQTVATRNTAALVALAQTTLTLTSVNASSVSISGPAYAGILVGNAANLNLNGSTLSGNTISGSGINAGGVAGRITANSTISNVTQSNFTITGSGAAWVGGMVGLFSPSANNDSLALSSVRTSSDNISTSSWSTGYAGGLIGYYANGACASGCVASMTNSTVDVSIPFTFGTNGFLYSGGMIAYVNDMVGGASTNTSTSLLNLNIGSANGSGGISGSHTSSGTVDKTRITGTQVYAHTVGSGGMFGQISGNAVVTDSAVQVATVGINNASQNVGGVVASAAANLTVQRVMVSSAVTGNTGNTNRGCFIGTVTGALTSADNFYDSDVCTLGKGRQTGAMAGVTPNTTTNMQTSTTYTLSNWLTSVWTFPASSYPKLLWE